METISIEKRTNGKARKINLTKLNPGKRLLKSFEKKINQRANIHYEGIS